MSRKRLEAKVVVREYEKDGKKKQVWATIGTAWEFARGGGYSMVLDLVPPATPDINGKMKVQFSLFEPTPKDGGEDGGGFDDGGF